MKELVPQVVRVKVKDLKNWEKNPREIEDSQYEALKDLIGKFGFMGTLKVDKDTYEVLGGNMRLRVAKELEIEELNCELVDVQGIALDNDQSYDDAKLEVALVDNNQFGVYVREKLIALIPTDTKIRLDVLKIDINPMTISDVVHLDSLSTNANSEAASENELEQYLDQKQESATLTFIVTNDQKEVIMSKLHQIKDENLLEKDGDALYELCRDTYDEDE